jgi:hypothetical protein
MTELHPFQALAPGRQRCGPPRPLSTNSGNSQPSPHIVPHPSIARREVLREFYLTNNPDDHLELLDRTSHLLDQPTALHLICYIADLSLKGQLLGDESRQNHLVHSLYTTLAEHVPSMRPPDLGAVLWAVASIPASASAEWSTALLDSVAERELNSGSPGNYNTREVANILAASGKLVRFSPTRRPSASAVVRGYALNLVIELTKRLDVPYVRGSFASGDFADITSACASIFAQGSEKVDVNSSIATRNVAPSEVAELMNCIAYTVRRHLANRHSLRSSLRPVDLVRFLDSYSQLEHRSPDVSSMLDGVASFIAAQLRAENLANAVTSHADMARVLKSYAALQHRSVAVPGMLEAMCMQLRRNAAALQDPITETDAVDIAPVWDRARRAAKDEPSWRRVHDLASVLEGHIALGFGLDSTTLHALTPGITTALPDAEPCDVLRVMESFAALQFNPGKATVGLLVARASMAGLGNRAEELGRVFSMY